MRTRGSVCPDSVHVEDSVKRGWSEVRVRGNIKQDGEEWAYDEYVLTVKTRENLKAEIEKALTEWLTVGRGIEADENASVVCDMNDEITDLYDTLADAAQSEYDTLIESLEG